MTTMAGGDGYLRIGELSRRTGVAPELLRAWERRYGPRPARSEGGFRLYSRGRRAAGRAHAPHTCARAWPRRRLPGARSKAWPTRLRSRPRTGGRSSTGAQQLRTALDGFDEAGAQAALDALFGTFTVETVLGAVILPYLVDLGERWSTGEATVAQSTSPAT